MKNLLLLSTILGSNMVLGGVAGFGGFGASPDTSQNGLLSAVAAMLVKVGMPFCGIGLGFFNGLKFTAVSAITDYFKPEDNTAIKAGVNLGIDVISGVLAYANTNPILGVGVFGTLFVMDAINFGIESYFDSPDCTELANIEINE